MISRASRCAREMAQGIALNPSSGATRGRMVPLSSAMNSKLSLINKAME